MKICFASLCALLWCGCASAPHAPVPPVLISQEQWGGEIRDTPRPVHEIKFITLHHGGEEYSPDQDTMAHLRQLQKWSRSEKKWSDIPYHYLIDWEGKIYAGRDLRYPGDTNTNYDPTGHALICVLGNFEIQTPNDKQLQAVIDLMTWLCYSQHVPVAMIRGHKDVAAGTVCPGEKLYAYLRSGYLQQQVAQHLAHQSPSK